MHCELVVPALFAAHEIPRLPSLELLLARGRATQAERLSLEAWLADRFELDEGPIPAGAIAIQASGNPDRGGNWLRADPVHLRLEQIHLSLIPGTCCGISRDEADAYIASLNRHFDGRHTFVAVRPDQWCLQAGTDAALESASPLELAGRNVDESLASDARSAQWSALLNEIQMALHEHPVNAEREARGAPPINSVWLWGAGRRPENGRGPWNSVTSDDVLAAGLAQLAGIRHRGLPGSAGEWLDRAPEEGRHLIVLDALRAVLALGGAAEHADQLAALEARWFVPVLEALRSHRIGMVTVHAPDSGRSYETIRSDLRRFWRRARPLAAYS